MSATGAAPSFDRIQVAPAAGSMGAEIAGVDLAGDLDNQTFDEIHRALLAHHLIFFRNQQLTPDSQAAFGRRFGPLNRHPYVKPLPEAPDVFAIVKEPDDIHHFGNGWHTDLSYTEKPALATMLYGVDIPPFGGDTLFTNLHQAYEALSDGMQQMLAGLTGVYSNARTYGPDAARFKDGVKAMSVSQQAEVNRVEHPLIRTHPETGRKSLYFSELHLVGLKDMSDEESAPILTFLARHCARPEFTFRFRWEKGSLALWDNRCTAHYAIDDFAGMRREIHRVTVEGDRPF
jgi:alpha-ketoglutarate-dependent taurine dioxygenase